MTLKPAKNLFSVSFTKKESADILDVFKANRLSPTVYTDDSFVMPVSLQPVKAT